MQTLRLPSTAAAAARGGARIDVPLYLPLFAPPAEVPAAVDPLKYDRIVVAFSGGKDSIACVLHLLEAGVPPERIELWHHLVDGREGSALMDWPCTEAYVRAFARALGIAVYFSWRVGGFERELLRNNETTAPIACETPSGRIHRIGGKGGRRSTRRRYPQTSADLLTRWCSGYLKTHVASAALRNQHRFRQGRTLLVSGERAAESPNRAAYRVFEPHEADLRHGRLYQRHIDRWRPVHAWTDREVWEIIARWRINPHPAYRLGFARVSCALCIFAPHDQVATILRIYPVQLEANARLEREFGYTIHRSLPLHARAASGTPYATDERDVRAALSLTFTEPILLPPGEWRAPAGAYRTGGGPP